jgi:hypothetical protein
MNCSKMYSLFVRQMREGRELIGRLSDGLEQLKREFG